MAEFRLETDRLILRTWRESDVDPFMRNLDTDEVMRWLGGRQPRTHYADFQQRMDRAQQELGHCYWIMEGKADGAILGFCGPRRGRHPGTPIYGELELGWRLCASHWGLGYAKEAALATIAWCRTNRPQDGRIIAYTVPTNVASWGLMRALGMDRREEMDFDHPAFPVGHPLCRHIVYALDRTA
ncbi:GNAT family N-acetyltransferase [Sphingobium sp. BYY-5]|uniref:GNAT family N-acetyltransferase n=1 Tax=Sphingobium sp. BYY-5 TaxID=2926400 RepID=UPI001FA7E590|nr:GNAT family N-acetyltransferase [Sphingobium sp. BYY-5]MCI4589090.1 GNAT family N-acetyltransferase [Sphingobium sp. BYY-5]